MNLRDSYLVVRETGTDVLDPEDGVSVILSGHPTIPGSWQSTAETGGWSSHVDDSGNVFDVLRINTIQQDTSKGLFLVVQREPTGRAALDVLAAAPGNDYAEPSKSVWQAATGGDASARAAMRHWTDWVVDGTLDTGDGPVALTGERMRIVPRDSGLRIPVDVLQGGVGPWHFNANGGEVTHGDPSEVLHVTAFYRPCLLQTIAGYDHDTSVKDTE